MPQEREQILIDHLDRVLAGETSTETETMIKNDQELSKEWRSILFAVEGIREAGLYEKVSIARNKFQSEQSVVVKPAGGVVRTLYRNAFRVAACFLLLIGAAAIYKYSTVSSGSIYRDSYQSFELNTSRSSTVQDTIEQAYRAKNWKQVLSISTMQKPTTTKINFLTAMAAMELKDYETAIESFKQVMAANAGTGDSYFQEEAEYYLALAYLANGEIDNALPLLQQIRNDEKHTYHQKAKELSGVDLMILELKSGK